jgi:hypothetical protein
MNAYEIIGRITVLILASTVTAYGAAGIYVLGRLYIAHRWP